MIPSNLYEFFIDKVNRLPTAAKLVLLLDPGGRLCLNNEIDSNLSDSSGRIWHVVRYDGNDLDFRRLFSFSQSTLVWVTGPRNYSASAFIDLTSLLDIVRRADEILDLSVIGCLQSFFPTVVWPIEPIEEFSDLIKSNIGGFIEAYKSIKPHIDPGAALSSFSIRALVLSCIQHSIQPVDFLFRYDSPTALLRKYVAMAWTNNWDENGLRLLQRQARDASLLSISGFENWFTINIHELAQFIYFYRSLSLGRIPNIINQIRGLGLLNFDPEPLEAGLGQIIALWEKDPIWRNRLIQNAENDLDLDIVHRASTLLGSDRGQLQKNLYCAEAPAITYSLIIQLIRLSETEGKTEELLKSWEIIRPEILDRIEENMTSFSPPLIALGKIFDEATFIQKSIEKEMVTISSLDTLMKWYKQGKYYDLEYAHARATMSLAKIKDESLRKSMQVILMKLRDRLREFLDRADHVLANQIRQNWFAYSTSPEISSNVLRDFVKNSRLSPTDDASIWVIIFDGMRFDTWEAIVKPSLMQVFEIKKEKSYFSPLPSWTSIARTSITAGGTPDLWKGFHNTFTTNQALLAGKFFGLNEAQYLQKIRFYSGMESDRVYNQFDRSRRYPYNILIFNISDDDLHKQRENVGALNESIKSSMIRILHFLDGLIQKDDSVIVTSDHGFMELDPGYSYVVKDSNKWQRFMEGGEHPVHYRFIRSEDPSEYLPTDNILQFEWKIQNGKFAVAVGRQWFQREGAKNPVRYDHGGLSFAEMVVPGALMQSIREKKIDLRFAELPVELNADEDQSIIVEVKIINKGNQSTSLTLGYRLDTDLAYKKINGEISPNGELDLTLTLNALVFSDDRKTKKLILNLEFNSINGQLQTRRQEIPINIKQRTDIVKISLGGLDDLDL